MAEQSTILLDKETIKLLQRNREYPRQSYRELLRHMIRIFEEVRKNNQYDEFLHKIQQQKMKELWDNKADEAWEHV